MVERYERKRKIMKLGLALLIFCFILHCWPVIELFDRPTPIILGLPPILFWTVLGIIITVICMNILYFLEYVRGEVKEER